MATENARGVRALLGRAIDEPAAATDELPQLLAALEHDDPVVRIGAGWALCAVAAVEPTLADDLHDRLRRRSSTAADLAAQWIERERLGVVDDAHSSTPTRPSGPGGEDRDAPEDEGSVGSATGREAGDDGHEAAADEPDTEAASDDADETRGATDRTDDVDDGSGPPGVDEVVQDGRFAIELGRTALDRLEVVDRVATDRHCWTYAAMASIDAEETAVLVRTYRPPQGARLSTFASAFESVAERWAGVDDHEGVLTVHDYGRRPHPWIVLEYAPATLRAAGRLPPLAAVQTCYDAASALAHAHERGVTHRSLDPRSVAVDPDGERPTGRLLNVGIVDAFEPVAGPLPMDSRFAAPELFDDEYGAVDHATDVYQLGAVLYATVTGRPPYESSLVDEGGPAAVPLDPPSNVVDGLPETIDRIVETATANAKIARYESAGELALALREAASELGGSV